MLTPAAWALGPSLPPSSVPHRVVSLTLLLDEHQQRSPLNIWLHICYVTGCWDFGSIFSLAQDEASLGDEGKHGRVPG